MDLKNLYREVFLDHNKIPRYTGALPPPALIAQGHNPLCGDQLIISCKVHDDRLDEVRFEGTGCAISTASASLMTEAVKGKTVAEIEDLYNAVHHLLTHAQSEAPAALGKLAALSGVAEYPARVKCATLAWHTLRQALSGENSTIKTE